MAIKVDPNVRCGNCKHHNREHDVSALIDDIRRCKKAVMFWDASEWKERDGTYDRVRNNQHKDTMMFVQDGSDYMAMLYTHKDFFCAHFEENNNGTT